MTEKITTDALERILNLCDDQDFSMFCPFCASPTDVDAHVGDCPVPAARAELASLRQRVEQGERDRDAAVRAEQEARGVIETYGIVKALRLYDRDVLRLDYEIAAEVFRASDGMSVFTASIKECAEQFADWRKRDAARSTPDTPTRTGEET